MDLFESARLKLERATEHLNEVYRRMGEADLSAWGRHIDPVEKVQNVIFRMKNPIDSRWALGIGDAVHNMRSALDYVIDDAARALQGRSTRYHFFPIAVDDGARQQAHNPVGRFRDWHPPLEGPVAPSRTSSATYSRTRDGVGRMLNRRPSISYRRWITRISTVHSIPGFSTPPMFRLICH